MRHCDKAEDGIPDGHISTKELFLGLEKVGVTVGQREMELLVGKFDFDGSGAIEFNEFARLIRNAAPAPQPEIQRAMSLINTKLYSE